MREVKAVVFDLDDTLYPEESYVASGFSAVAIWANEQLGKPGKEAFSELWQLFCEGVRGNTFDIWLERNGFDPKQFVSNMISTYQGHEPQISPYDGVVEMLKTLGQTYRLGLVTDGYLDVQRKKLASLSLCSAFNAIVLSDELGRDNWKPNPNPFNKVLEKLIVPGAQAIYVADNPTKDFLGARKVGMFTIRVRHKDGLYKNLEPPSPDYAPDLEIENITDTAVFLERIGGIN